MAARRVFLLLFGILLAALLAETLLRVVPVFGGRDIGESEVDARDLPEITSMWGLLKPGALGRYRGARYSSNSAGFRGPEFPETKPPGTFRIVIVGDSVTMGSGVRYEQAYPELLAEALNGSGDTMRYEVLNLGISGLTLHASVRRLINVGMRFDPDLVVYGYTVNDIEGEFYRKSFNRPPFAEAEAAAARSRLLTLLAGEWQFFRDQLWHPHGSYFWELDDNYFRNPRAWQAFQDDMAQLVRTADSHGLCVGMLIHTDLESLHTNHPFQQYYEAARTAARTAGLPVLESLPFFEGRRAASLWVTHLDHHPNAEGHRILARALMEGLAGLPVTCWGGRRPAALDQLRRGE